MQTLGQHRYSGGRAQWTASETTSIIHQWALRAVSSLLPSTTTELNCLVSLELKEKKEFQLKSDDSAPSSKDWYHSAQICENWSERKELPPNVTNKHEYSGSVQKLKAQEDKEFYPLRFWLFLSCFQRDTTLNGAKISGEPPVTHSLTSTSTYIPDTETASGLPSEL